MPTANCDCDDFTVFAQCRAGHRHRGAFSREDELADKRYAILDEAAIGRSNPLVDRISDRAAIDQTSLLLGYLFVSFSIRAPRATSFEEEKRGFKRGFT